VPCELIYGRPSYYIRDSAVYATNSNLGPILLRLRDIAGFLLKTTPPYSTRILEVFPLDYIADVWAPRSEDPKLVIV